MSEGIEAATATTAAATAAAAEATTTATSTTVCSTFTQIFMQFASAFRNQSFQFTTFRKNLYSVELTSKSWSWWEFKNTYSSSVFFVVIISQLPFIYPCVIVWKSLR